LLKTFPHDQLKLVSSPHINDIQLFLDSGWDKHFLKKTLVICLKQFLCVDDHARVVEGSLQGKLGMMISINHTLGTISLDPTPDGCVKEIEVQLQDIEHVFHVSDSVKVVAGSY
jgi:hypothetical protein